MQLSMPEYPEMFTVTDDVFHVPLRAIPLKTLGISVYLAEITPEVAEVMLRKKNINRSFRLPQLNKIKRTLEMGRWEINGETIIFDEAGQLIEGQHRLKAVVETGVTIYALVVHGIDRERFKTMGQGAKRTVGDILGIQGEKNSRTLGAALRWVYRYDHDLMMNPHPNITDDELADTMPEHQELPESIPLGIKSHSLAAPGMITALHYLCGKRHKATANHFFWTFATGEHLERGDVLLVLRDRFMKAMGKKQTRLVLRDEQKAPMIINAWNIIRKEGYVKLKDGKRLQWQGKRGQKFPKIL